MWTRIVVCCMGWDVMFIEEDDISLYVSIGWIDTLLKCGIECFVNLMKICIMLLQLKYTGKIKRVKDKDQIRGNSSPLSKFCFKFSNLLLDCLMDLEVICSIQRSKSF